MKVWVLFLVASFVLGLFLAKRSPAMRLWSVLALALAVTFALFFLNQI